MDTTDPYPGRRAHWIRGNETERSPHRWIVADSEGTSCLERNGEIQTLRCVDAVRWRDDLKTGDHAEWHAGEDAQQFWQWVDDYTRAGHRTVVWFHNASYDLRVLDAFRILPQLGWQLVWCNLDREVSVVTWRSLHGTLQICDTYSWLPKPLTDIGGMVGIGKPRLPKDKDSLAAWHRRCRADVEITRAAVLELLAFVRGHHLGNWQPTGSGQGYATWRHRFLTHKVLVHDDAPAIAAERAAMHTGRAEAWWHGKPAGGPFTEMDMHMAYCRIAAECAVPVKLWAYDGKPTRQVHSWAMKHWTVLCRVEVTTAVPCVPHHTGERTIWPVGTFQTTLWQPELELITRTGGSYTVLEQWRYNAAPALADWAKWTIFTCGQPDTVITPVQKTYVKHQSRALIGRLGLRNSTWEQWGANPFGWLGLTDYVDGDTGETARMLHVGDQTFMEGERTESDSSLPQITGWIMSECRVRLWDAAAAAGPEHVVHLDTDSLIVDRHGKRALEAAAQAGLSGHWRAKERWSGIEVTGPRHYRATGRRVIPGVPRTATETSPGCFRGEVWQSLGAALAHGNADRVQISQREWRVKQFDGRRPWADGPGPAQPIRLPAQKGCTSAGPARHAGRDPAGRGPRPGRPVAGDTQQPPGRHRRGQHPVSDADQGSKGPAAKDAAGGQEAAAGRHGSPADRARTQGRTAAAGRRNGVGNDNQPRGPGSGRHADLSGDRVSEASRAGRQLVPVFDRAPGG